MSVDAFLDLLRRYGENDCTADEIELIGRVYDRLRDDIEPLLSANERLTIEQYLWQRIEQRIDALDRAQSVRPHQALFTVTRPESRRQPHRSRWWAAAAFLLITGIGATLVYRGSPTSRIPTLDQALAGNQLIKPTNWINTTNQRQSITLADGSHVLLEPGSQLRTTAKENAHKREFWLTGRAFFKVQKNTDRPFLVYTSSVVTRVLGTSFWVNAPKNTAKVDVSVCTGLVRVSRQVAAQPATTGNAPTGAGVLLTPNQQVTFYTDKSQWAKGLVAAPRPLNVENDPAPASFVFDESPLADVLQALQQQYGIEIVAGKPLDHCRFTGDISQQSFYAQIELVCRAINASYEIIGTQVVISGPGCTPL